MRGVFNIIFRIVSSVIGLLMVLMGGIWVMQGLSLATGRMAQSFMENDRRWALFGAILIVVGLGQLIWSNTRQTRGS